MVGAVRAQQIQGQFVANFSLATEYNYKSDKAGGEWVKETTWHNVIFWSKTEQRAIVKGAPVHVIGRLRTRKYTGQDNVERTVMEVLASSVAVLLRDAPPSQPEGGQHGKDDIPF